MAASKGRNKIRLVSYAKNKNGRPTKYTYTTTVNKKKGEKLALKKYNPQAYDPETGKLGMYVLFTEEKIK